MNAKHTPGPWHVSGNSGETIRDVKGNALARKIVTPSAPGEASANMRLMAAAPDLLSAIDRYMNESPDVPAGIDVEADTIHAQMYRARLKARSNR